MEAVNIVAQSPGGEALLFDMGDGFGGRVLDTSLGILFAPRNMQSILARGYWSPPTGDVDPGALLNEAERQDLDVVAQAKYDADLAAWTTRRKGE